jgi:hypothetical protein
MDKSVAEIIREMESNFESGETQMSEYVSLNLKEDINTIEAYTHSKHIHGEYDSQDREKPFFNIVIAAVNIWFRATDIDRKNIHIKATKEAEVIPAFLATVHLQEFMRKSNFGMFLNKWGYQLATYLSAVVKFVEQGGKLIPSVVPWTRLICDPIDFDANPKIEKLYFTPAQLKKNKNYDQEQVKALLEALTTRKDSSRQNKDTKADYIEVYEIHGEFPLSQLTDKEKDTEYVQQMHVLSFVKGKGRGEFDDFTLYSGREKDPYMLTCLLPNVDGSVSLNGAVKNLFNAQWMVNHTAKSIKDQLDLASKLVFQTSDGNFVGRNVLSAIENGDILIHALNQPLTSINNTAHDIAALQSFRNDWQNLGNQINGISESMLGINPPSGTAWRQVQTLLQESHSLFELMTENKGLAIEEMLRRFVLPFLKKKMDTKDEIMATLESHQIKWVDSRYVPAQATRIRNAHIKEAILNGQQPNPPDQTALEQDIQKTLNSYGNQRPFKPSDISTETWKNVLKDLEWEVEVDVTGESKDKQAVLDTLNTALQVVVNPAYATNPDAKMIVGKILEETSVLSPLELGFLNNVANPVAPVVPANGGGGVGTGIKQPIMQ